MRFRTSDDKTKKQFAAAGIACNISYLQLSSFKYEARIVSTGDSDSPNCIIFIHGAPGSSSAFDSYLKTPELLEKAYLISIDRPGYGYTNFGKAETSVIKQGQLVSDVINALKIKAPVLVVGHSYGGPVAAYTALVNNKISGVLMLAPAIDPDNEKKIWGSGLAKYKITRWLIPASFKVSADEKNTHAAALRPLVSEWPLVRVPVVHMHGTKDVLVPFKNMGFSAQHFKADIFSQVVMPEVNHFIPWSHKKEVLQEIEKLLAL